MQKMIRTILTTIREHALFATGDTVVVAVSGGADSVALLDILVSLQQYRLRLVVAHLNHALRGAESDADQRFVADLAAGYGLPFVTETVDVAALSRRERRSLEDAGRQARYAFFERAASAHGADSVALAHHADDQAETVIMRLLRGSGITGLSAMRPCRDGRYVRPLLALTRSEIERYLRSGNIGYRVDPSNEDVAFLRNRIRHEIMPRLAALNPEICRRLAVCAELLAADEELLVERCDSSFARLAQPLPDGVISFSVPALRAEPRGVRYRLYRQALQEVRGNLLGISFGHICQIEALLRSLKPNGRAPLPSGAIVTRAYDLLRFLPSDATQPVTEFFIDGPGCYRLPGGGELLVDLTSVSLEWTSVPPTKACFDLDKVPFPWVVRTFRPGDRIAPLGMTGRKKVKDLFIDEKIPMVARSSIPLIFYGDNLLWVCGVRRGGSACVTAQTSRVVAVEFRGRCWK